MVDDFSETPVKAAWSDPEDTDHTTAEEADQDTLDKAIDEDESPIVAFVKERFDTSRVSRRRVQDRWLDAYRDYRGQYHPGVTFRETEKSRVFIKIAKTKTLAAYGQLVEIVFSGQKFPIGIRPTERPEGIAEYAHIDPKDTGAESDLPPELDVGFVGDGDDSAFSRIKSKLSTVAGGIASKYGNANFLPGPATDPKQPEIKPADLAAKEMEKTVHDQLTEAHAAKKLRSALFEMCLYGTGIIKGPFNYEKEVPQWSIDSGSGKGTYEPITKLVPRIEAPSVWSIYPDPEASGIDDADSLVERHKMPKSGLLDLIGQYGFDADEIYAAINDGPDYLKLEHENYIEDTHADGLGATNRWEVLEYWGTVPKGVYQEIDVNDAQETASELFVNVFICNGRVLRAISSPVRPQRIPYYAGVYEKNPNEFFGIGVPENMSDSTMIMNGHARMAIDNLALSGGLVFDIDESMLVAGQSMDIYNGKIFRRRSGAPGQAVYGVKFPNTTQENLMMFDKFRQLSDESTGIPSYSHGATGSQGMTRTASGMSMLMGAAALNIKTVVKNLDDYLLQPLAEALYHWNMRFNPDELSKGDMEVKALGTEAIMQKEVRSQRLMQFLQIVSNPMMAPFVKWDKIVKEVASSLDIDPEDIINDVERAKIFATIMGMAGGVPGSEQNPAGPDQGVTGTGDGTIGTGQVPMPGEQEFAANDTAAGTGAGPNALTKLPG